MLSDCISTLGFGPTCLCLEALCGQSPRFANLKDFVFGDYQSAGDTIIPVALHRGPAAPANTHRLRWLDSYLS
jgi:hypothetical protein